MRRSGFLLSFLLLIAVSPLPAQQRSFYSGTVGKLAVTMSLDFIDESIVSGSYRYAGRDESIALTGSFDREGTLYLTERIGEDLGTVSGNFKGAIDRDGDRVRFSGTWSSPDGRRSLPFDLRWTATAVVVDYYDTTTSRSNVSMRYPQIATAAGEPMQALNDSVKTWAMEHWREFASWTNEDLTTSGDSFSVRYWELELYVSLEEISDELATFSIVRIAWGGAHPSNERLSLNYDLRDGVVRRLYLRDLFRPGTAYVERIAREIFSALVRAKYECVDSYRGGESFGSEEELDLTARITDSGLVFDPWHPHVCIAPGPVTIPWKKLKDLVDPRGPAGRFIK